VWQDEAKHCPLCSAELLQVDFGGRPRLRCGRCTFVLYSNPASAAAGVVFNPRGEVLLVRRAIEPYRGYWALPAGYQEIDEPPSETVAREVLEEAGIAVEVHGLLDLLFVHDDPRRPANVAVFLCRAVGGRPEGGRRGGRGGLVLPGSPAAAHRLRQLRPDPGTPARVRWLS